MTETEPEPIAASLTLEAACARAWDAIVVGAGPAGAVAADRLARGGAAVLLVDKCRLPRPKVCGCCLSGFAGSLLRELSLEHVLRGSVLLDRLRLSCGRRAAEIRLRNWRALSRTALDARLVRAAMAAGAAFLPSATARIEEVTDGTRAVRLRHGDREGIARGHVVVAATGLAGKVLEGQSGITCRHDRESYLGVGAVIHDPPAIYRPGVVHMACGRFGYVGLVRLENGDLDVAAALAPASIRSYRGVAPAIASILSGAGLPRISESGTMRWRGTPLLTRRLTPVGADRLLLIGDAAGYVEPFTGEGIGWALASGAAAAEVLLSARAERPANAARLWIQRHARLIGRRQRLCRALTFGLRCHPLVRAAIYVLSRVPSLAAPVVREVSRPSLQRVLS